VTAHAGNVNTIPYDYGDVGGLAGTTFGSISECYSTATVRSVSSDGSYGGYWGAFAGGLVGVAYSLYNDVSITNCYATGSVGGLTYVGGLIGMIVGDDNWYGEIVGPYTITIANCYASGNVVGYSGGCGGFTGRVMGAANIENCFSLGNVNGSQGWFSNLNDAVALAGYANDYFLARTGQPDPVISGVSSATAVQLGNVNFAVYHGSTPWNFTSVWAMHNGLPELRLWTAA
jgi:hypothetical protein